MKIVKFDSSYKIVKLKTPVFGGFYAIMQYNDIIKDGLSLDAAIEVFNELTK